MKTKELIDKLTQFSINYKKKNKKERNGGQNADLLTPHRYHNKREHHS